MNRLSKSFSKVLTSTSLLSGMSGLSLQPLPKGGHFVPSLRYVPQFLTMS